VPVATTVPDNTDRRQSARSARHAAQRILWAESRLKPVKLCGLHARNDTSGQVAIKATGTGESRRAGVSGVMRCGSTWACPVCSHKISATRAEEVTAAIEKWQNLGPTFRVALLTLTMRHKEGQSLLELWAALSNAWEKVTSGRGWVNDQALYGTWLPRQIKSGEHRGEIVSSQRIPFVRVVEATHGRNGWHVHIHCVLFLGPTMTADAPTPVDVQALGYSMFRRWRRALAAGVKKRGSQEYRVPPMATPTRSRGVDIKLVTEGATALGDYFAKAVYPAHRAAGFEATMGQHKAPKNGNRTPFTILADIAANGDAADLDLWHEWERGSKGRRQLTWSPGLREFLALGDEQTDEQVADDDSLNGDVLVTFDAGQWPLVRSRVPALLDAAEADDTGLALYQLLSGLLPLWNRDHCSVNSS